MGKPSGRKGKKFPEWSMENHWGWKGQARHTFGYILIKKPTHPSADHQGYVKRSHLVAEKTLGRFLNPKEIVHHINEIKDDDRPENLRVFPNISEHIRFHGRNKRH